MSDYKPTLNFYFFNNMPLTRVLSFEYWIDKISWEWGLLHQQVSTVHHTPSKSNENIVK